MEGSVALGDNTKTVKIFGTGNTRLNHIDNALYVPDICQSILDLGGYITTIKDGRLVCRDKFNSVVLTATLTNNLYYLDEQYMQILLGKDRLPEMVMMSTKKT